MKVKAKYRSMKDLTAHEIEELEEDFGFDLKGAKGVKIV